MNSLIDGVRKPALLLSLLMGGAIFTSCAAAPSSNSGARLGQKAPQAALPASDSTTGNFKTDATAQLPKSHPQLIKKATLTLIVDSVDKSIQAATAIVEKDQGDLIRLEDQKPENDTGRHTAFMEVRIPQERLESSLEELTKLGTVKGRSITAEDVGSQLVDIQARLTNLRATETNLQKIMDRAGSIKDVLSVSQELSNVRQSIEQIDAQLKSLQNQVAYSTISLNLEATISSTSGERTLPTQIQETWNNSTHSFGELTIGLLKLSIWLLVYSPFFLVLAAIGYGFKRWRRSNRSPVTPRPNVD